MYKWGRRQLFSQCPFLFAPTLSSLSLSGAIFMCALAFCLSTWMLNLLLFGPNYFGVVRLAAALARSFALILCARFRPPSAFFIHAAPAGSDDVMILSLRCIHAEH